MEADSGNGYAPGWGMLLMMMMVVARLSLSYGPSLCLSFPLSHCLSAVREMCHIGLAACNKSSFFRSFVIVRV